MNVGKKYSTAFAFFGALWESGVKNCFVNLGSDHPSIVEAIIKGRKERPAQFPKIYTCPSEMTAISMADGYARVTGRPQAVIVHVDVGTQALAHGVHNASVGRAPVLIFSGLSPFTESGELKGSRTEYMHWLQDPPDQKAVVRQFCRYVGEIRSGLNVKQVVSRALQFANSDPKGPAYIAGAREVLAEMVTPYSLNQEQWGAIKPSALPHEAIETITKALVQAERPLVITGYAGRDRRCPAELVRLADTIPGLRVLDTGGSDMCFPFTHRASQGFSFAMHDCTKDADVILLLDCDVPWIPSKNPPPRDAQIYHIDVDPLNYMMPVSFFPANGRWRADSYTALKQLNEHLQTSPLLNLLRDPKFRIRWDNLGSQHRAQSLAKAQIPALGVNDPLTAHNIGALLKRHLPVDTVYAVGAATSTTPILDQLNLQIPGTWINAGGTGIGWSVGAALGVKLGLNSDDNEEKANESFVCQIVGDGAYLCGSPASAAWVASKYKIPILTILLNNGAWNAPRNSTLIVYPDTYAAAATNEEMGISLNPPPDYAEMTLAAAGGSGVSELFARKVTTVGEFEAVIGEAVTAVKEKRGAFVDAIMVQRK